MKLYEIQNGYRQWQAKIEEQDGELTEQDLIDFDNLEAQADDKIEAYAVIIKEKKAEAKMYAEEIERLTSLKKRAENISSNLTERPDMFLTEQGKTKFESIKAQISYRKSVAVEITPDAQLPEEYLRIKTEFDKTKIKDFLKEGGTLEGCSLVEKQNIQIK